MVIYCKSVHFGGFSSPGTSGQAFYEMVSFSENRALRLLQESGEPRPCVLSALAIPLTVWTGQGQAWLHHLGRGTELAHSLPFQMGWAWGWGLGGGGAWAQQEACTSDHPHPFQETALFATTSIT